MKAAKLKEMVRQGIAGSQLGHRKSSQVHKDKKKALKQGDSKHKNKYD